MWGRDAFDYLFLKIDVISAFPCISPFFSGRFCFAGVLVVVVKKYRGNIFTIKIHVSIKTIQALKLEDFSS